MPKPPSSLIDATNKPPQTRGTTTQLRKLLPFIWNVTASIANQGSTVAINIFIVRLSSIHVFGRYAAVQAAVLALASIMQLSAWFTATKFTAELVDTDRHRLEQVLGLLLIVAIVSGGIGTIGLFVSSSWYAETVLASPDLARGIMLASGFVVCTVINSFQAGTLLGCGAIGTYAKSSIILVPFVVLLPIAGLAAAGESGALAGLTLGALLRCVVTQWILQRELALRKLQIRYGHFAENAAVVWHFSLPASANGLTNAGATWIVSILIVQTVGGFKNIALYSAVATLKTLILFIPYQINNVAITLINRASGAEPTRRRSLFWRNLIVLVGLTAACAAPMILFASQVIQIYSRAFIEGSVLLRIYMIGAIGEALSFALMQYFSAGKRLWKPLVFGGIPRDVSFVLLSYIFLRAMGINGVGVAYLASWSACSVGYAALIAQENRHAKFFKT